MKAISYQNEKFKEVNLFVQRKTLRPAFIHIMSYVKEKTSNKDKTKKLINLFFLQKPVSMPVMSEQIL